jgi:osmotically-inducible protein OsmY
MTSLFDKTPGLIAVVALLSASACHKANPVAPASSSASAGGPSVLAVPIADEAIKGEVTSELHKDKKIDQAGINVTVTAGIVALTGKVDNLLSSDRSTRIAESVRGVRSVSNRLSITPAARPDQSIQGDVQKALLYNAATAKMPIYATAKGGIVTLTGSVQSRQEKQLAERIADGVRGVRLTQNELTQKSDAKREDGTIANDVKSRLAWDVLVEHDPITATAKDAQVTLAGTVGSAAEKSRAVNDAWVDGVAKVDATALEVKWWDQPDKNLRPFTVKSDQDIATAIKDAAYYDPRVKSFNINPSVSHGVATLTGTVSTLKAKMAAEALARNTVGVTTVVNLLVARSQEPVTDRVLENRVKDALIFDPIVEAHDVFVTVKDGQVTLSGNIGTYFESAEAFDVASRLAGVTNVDNRLQVLDPAVPYVYAAYLDPFTPYVEAWYVVSPRPLEADSKIQDRINAEFSWSPFVRPEDVHVVVSGGRVTLTGTVQTFRERRAAGESALEAGAVSVDNELKVG